MTIAGLRRNRPVALGIALALPLFAVAAGGALAQQEKKQASPFQGFSSDNGKPVDVNSDSLEVYQNEQKAIFVGNVVAVQGDSTLKTPRLVVYYENTNPAGANGGSSSDAGKPEAAPAKTSTAPSSQSSIKRLEASGGVVVTSQDQKATGDNGVFDMATNTAVLTGNVVMTQGANVVRGKELHVDLKTGLAKVSGGTNAIFIQNNNGQQTGQPKAK